MSGNISNSTTRFSSRVDNYIKYRPGYPVGILELLRTECGLTAHSTVADVGSGTGKLTELFLKNGNLVFGIEPNLEMREAAERLLKPYARFQSIAGTAEATTLQSHSVDFITAGQAFHWFNRELARREFIRILKPKGWVALIWNDRKISDSPFLKAYEELLVKFATEYRAVNHKNIDAEIIGSFFGAGGFKHATFPNVQFLDLDSLKGRLLSSSYAPEAGHSNNVPMLETLNNIFHEYQSGGRVTLECDTSVYYGQMPA